MEQYFQGAASNNGFEEDDGPPFQILKSSTTELDEAEDDDDGSVGFECNICLELVQDPVVTLCGHLYCWPCIYQWISFQDDDASSHCPVCKTQVSEKTLIPLYARGRTPNAATDRHLSSPIPQRPPSPRCLNNRVLPNVSRNYSDSFNQLHGPRYAPPYGPDQTSFSASPTLVRGRMTHAADPMIGMLGEMVYARMSGNSERTLYAYPNSYHVEDSSSPRMRRLALQSDKSLSRVCFFLFCCMILCLLLF